MGLSLRNLGKKLTDFVGGTDIQAGQRSIDNANQQLRQPARYGNSQAAIQSSQTGFNPVTTGAKIAAMAAPRIINDNLVQPIVNTASIPLSLPRLGVANLTHNTAAANNARIGLGHDAQGSLFSGNIPFEQSIASALNAPIANHYANQEADRAQRVLGDAYAPFQGGQNTAEVEAGRIKQDILNEPLRRAGIGQNDSLPRVALKVGAQGTQAGLNSIFLADMANSGPLGAVERKLTGQVAEKAAETTLKDRLVSAGLNAGANVAGVAQQDHATFGNYLKAGATGGFQGLALPIASELTGKALGGAAKLNESTALTPRGRINIAEQNTLRDFSDYIVGANKARPSEASSLIAQAREIGKKYGIDLTTGSVEQRLNRANAILDTIGQKQITPVSADYTPEVNQPAPQAPGEPAYARNRPSTIREAEFQRRNGVDLPMGKKEMSPTEKAYRDQQAALRDTGVPAYARGESGQSAKDLLARAAYQKGVEAFDQSTLGYPNEPAPTKNLSKPKVSLKEPKPSGPQDQIDAIDNRAAKEGRALTKSEEIKIGLLMEKLPGTKPTVAAKTEAVATPEPSFGGVANKVGTLTRLLASKVTVLRKIGTDSSHALADSIIKTDQTHQTLRAYYRAQVPTVLSLPKNDFSNFWDVVENGGKPSNPQVAKAVEEWRNLSPKIRQDGIDPGIKIGDQPNYLPREYDPNVFKAGTPENASAATALVKAGEAKDIADAQRTLRTYQNSSAKTTFSHFEKTRSKANIPGSLQSKNVIERYLDNAALRTAKAQNFGPNGEIGQKLITNVQQEGGDAKLAAKAVGNYMNAPEGGSLSKPLGAARGVYAATRLAKAAISHSIQTTNVAVDTRLRDFASGWKSLITKNPEASAFVKEADTLNPANIHGLSEQETGMGGRLSRVTAPGLGSVMKGNRFIATIAGKNYGDWLAKRGDSQSIVRLRELGVDGDIGHELTHAQQLQVARGVVDETMFNPTRASTPISAETGIGKTVGQYRTAYSYKQTGFLWNRVVKEAQRGNLAPLLKLAAISAPANASITLAKNKISGTNEGPGGIAADTAAALGGIPGELIEGAVRYGPRNLTKTVAGDVAPLAGEAVDLTDRVGKAVNGNLKPLGSYVAGLAPIIGSRLSKTINPPPLATQPVDPSNIGKSSNADIKAQGKVDAKDLEASAKPDGYLVNKLTDGRYAYKLDGSTDIHYTTDLASANKAVAKDSLAKSDASSKTINDKYYYKDENGDVQVTPLYKHQFDVADSQNQLDMSVTKDNEDYPGWVDSANKELSALETLKNKYNKESQGDKVDDTQKKIEALKHNMELYASYGGAFKKGSGNSPGSAYKYAVSLKAGGSAPKAESQLRVGNLVTSRAGSGFGGKPKVSIKKALT